MWRSDWLISALKSPKYRSASSSRSLAEETAVCPILFTCTTFLSIPGKYAQLDRALKTILDMNTSQKIRKMLVINEYSNTSSDEEVSKLRKKYPNVHFVSKTESQQGQAKSLNIIIDELKLGRYKYWLQWEESWFATRPFVELAYSIMESHDIDQLQLTNNFRYAELPADRRTDFQTFHIVHPKPEYPPAWRGHTDYDWPLFSLRPGMNKVSAIEKTGYFDESKSKWPITFEYEYAMRWVEMQHKKAVIHQYSATRDATHISTYKF